MYWLDTVLGSRASFVRGSAPKVSAAVSEIAASASRRDPFEQGVQLGSRKLVAAGQALDVAVRDRQRAMPEVVADGREIGARRDQPARVGVAGFVEADAGQLRVVPCGVAALA